MLSQNAKNLLNNYEEYTVGFDRYFTFSIGPCHYRDNLFDLDKNTKDVLITIAKALDCDRRIYNEKKQQLLNWLLEQ